MHDQPLTCQARERRPAGQPSHRRVWAGFRGATDYPTGTSGVPAAELLAHGCNLDRKNPRAKEDITHLPPAQLAADILKKEQRIGEIMGTIQKLLSKAQ